MMETKTVSKKLVRHNQNQVTDIATACVMLKIYYKHKPTDSQLQEQRGRKLCYQAYKQSSQDRTAVW